MADGMKVCSACKTAKPLDGFHKNRSAKDGLQTKCRPCHAASTRRSSLAKPDKYRAYWTDYRREYRRKNREADLDKVLARKAVERALKRGGLTRPPACETCGGCRGRIEAHHESYAADDRLSVVWLCRLCHEARHAAMAKAAP